MAVEHLVQDRHDHGHQAAAGAAAEDLTEQGRAIGIDAGGRRREAKQVADDQAAEATADQACQ